MSVLEQVVFQLFGATLGSRYFKINGLDKTKGIFSFCIKCVYWSLTDIICCCKYGTYSFF